MKIPFYFLLICILAATLAGCDNDLERPNIQAHNDTLPFVVPDSIETNLLIAMFDENDPPGHSLLVFSNGEKKSARKIKYHNDLTVSVEPLSITNYRELRSDQTNTLYLVKDKTVTMIQGTPNVSPGNVSVNSYPSVSEHRRTDTHIREFDVMIRKQ